MLLLKNDTLRFTDTLKYPSLLRLLGLATIYFGQQCPRGGAAVPTKQMPRYLFVGTAGEGRRIKVFVGPPRRAD